MDHEKLVLLLRKELNLTEEEDVTNEELLQVTKGTLLRTRLELILAFDEVKDVIKEEIIGIGKRLVRKKGERG